MEQIQSIETVSRLLLEAGVSWGGRVLGVLVALFVAWLFAGWLRRSMMRSCEAKKLDPTLTRFFGNLIRYAVLGGAVVGCLGVFGIQTARFEQGAAAMPSEQQEAS